MASIDVATDLLQKMNLGAVPSSNSIDAKTWAASAKSAGNRAFARGDFNTAIGAFTGCIAADPSDKVFYSNRSAALAGAERFEEAAQDAQKCIDLDPTWAKGYSRLGFAWFKQNKLAESHSSYKAGLRVEPANKALLAGVEMVNRAIDAVEPVIGIDLGTTYSCCAIYRNGETVVLPNQLGENTTPSWVAFTDDGRRLVGAEAKRQAAANPTRTLFNIKRIIGRECGECHEEIKRMPFAVVPSAAGKPLVRVDEHEFLPEQISAMVLESMKASAEAALGRPVTKAVITVPAYFTDAQRRLTKDAGAIAGLEVLRIINEPTAAALAYGLDKKATRNKANSANVLVFDLGGGTFDVSLLKIDNGVFEVLSTAGDTHLGGEDFDSALADFVQAAERKAREGVDVFAGDAGALRKLRNACERAKRELSVSTSTELEVSVSGGACVRRVITRAEFEAVCEPIMARCLESVQRALRDAKCSVNEVDEVVLVGGSTRVPRVQALLRDFFNGKKLCKRLHPDEAVAHGAAVQASILSGVRDASTDNLLLVDVIPMSLGIECAGKQFAVVVPRNTSIPCHKSHEFTTVEDYQTEVDVRVFEGERAITDGNHLLGSFTIRGIERAKKGVAKVDVSFSINSNGLLTVTARDKVTGAKAHVDIDHDTGRLTPDEIDALAQEARRLRAQDEKIAAELERQIAQENDDQHHHDAVEA